MNTFHTFTLREQLKHPGYNWPTSLVRLPVRLSEQESACGRLILLDGSGEAVPVQLANRRPEGDAVLAEAAFLTDLPCGSEKTFRLCTAGPSRDSAGEALPEAVKGLSATEDENGIRVETSLFTLTARRLPVSDTVFTLLQRESGVTARALLHTGKTLAGSELVLGERGPVFADMSITLRFTDGARYMLRIRAVDTFDFVELAEEMEGFTPEDPASLELVWENFAPLCRGSEYRFWEKIDEYADEEGRMPFHLKPYDSWVSWWSTKYASFIDPQAGYGAGIFVKNADTWSDEGYALWRSPEAPAVRFQYGPDELLRFDYPLVNGRRCTAICVYPVSREEDTDFHLKATGDGLYGMQADSPLHYPYVQHEWFWQEFIALDKVRCWTLRWKDDRSAYPRFFPPENMPERGAELWYLGVCREPARPEQVEKIVYELSNSMNQLISTGPVSNREFFDWVIAFDMAAPRMAADQFDNLRASFAFMAYALSEECYMPVRHTLSGHPNFLTDGRACGALAAALFPSHPDAARWRDQFELAMARNLKYHTRPAVEAWNAQGGRWTENLGCYVFASMNPMIKIQALLARTYGEHVLLYPNFALVARYLLDMLSAPVGGIRTFPPAGAHSGQIWDPVVPPYTMSLLADQLFCFDPLLAEYWRHESSPETRENEERTVGTSLYRSLAGRTYADQAGTRPPLRSVKYTGFGYVLRANTHTPEEISVHLLQIDEGPNYRWGRAGQGGCGNLWYYARGKRYSAQRPEDVGDWDKGDVQSCSNFGVLIGHEYHSVGRNEVSEPLYDFDFAQFAQADASPEVHPFYRSRSVMMSGGDYIVVYDAVGDMTTHGRFAWFQKKGEPFPSVAQLKPGCSYVETDGGIPIDEPGRQPDGRYAGRYYEGEGDFLTLVSHLPVNRDRAMYAFATEFGARVELQGRTDFIFRSGAKIRYSDDKYGFTGYAGIIRSYGAGFAQAALFRGTSVRVLGVEVTLGGAGALPAAGVAFTVRDRRVYGKIQCSEDITLTISCAFDAGGYALYLDGLRADAVPCEGGVTIRVPKGASTWEYTTRLPVPAKPAIERAVVSAGSVVLQWSAAAGAERYVLERSDDCGESWTAVAETKAASWRMEGLENGRRLHVRVAGVNADARGAFCWDYPVTITDQPPFKSDGLRVRPTAAGLLLTWGRQLGVSGYRLYRRCGSGDFKMIYEGEAAAFTDTQTDPDAVCAYAVAAVNGNGEGERSNIRDNAPGGLAFWDPEPDVKFRRYLPSHEYGYHGFDHWKSYGMHEAEPYPG